MTDAELDELERLTSEMTPGPFRVDEVFPCICVRVSDGQMVQTAADARWEAAWRNAAAKLIAEVRRLRALVPYPFYDPDAPRDMREGCTHEAAYRVCGRCGLITAATGEADRQATATYADMFGPGEMDRLRAAERLAEAVLTCDAAAEKLQAWALKHAGDRFYTAWGLVKDNPDSDPEFAEVNREIEAASTTAEAARAAYRKAKETP